MLELALLYFSIHCTSEERRTVAGCMYLQLLDYLLFSLKYEMDSVINSKDIGRKNNLDNKTVLAERLYCSTIF